MILQKIFFSFLNLLIGGIFYGLLLGGIGRKITARMQNRRGPTVFQNFIDVWKLFRKRSAIGHGVMFYLAPVFRFIGGAGVFLLVPIVFSDWRLSNFSFNGDLLVVLYYMFLGCLGMALGAAESGHPHSAIAITRGLSQLFAYEVPFILSVIVIIVSSHSLSLNRIVELQRGGILNWNLFRYPFASVAGFVAFLGMMMNSPFDVVLAPQEIPVGPPTEYSSTFLSFMFTGRSVFAVGKYLLFMNLYLGGASSIPEAILKTFLIFLYPLIIGNLFPRFRLDQSVSFFLKYPSVIGLIDLVRIIVR